MTIFHFDMNKNQLKDKVEELEKAILEAKISTLENRIVYLERRIEILKGGGTRVVCSECDLSFTALKINDIGDRWVCFECLDNFKGK